MTTVSKLVEIYNMTKEEQLKFINNKFEKNNGNYTIK